MCMMKIRILRGMYGDVIGGILLSITARERDRSKGDQTFWKGSMGVCHR